MHQYGSDQRTTTADGSWMAWAAIGLAAIWVAVLLISLLAPDMVSGSEQQHLPIAAFATWFWGLLATGALLWGMTRLRGTAARRPIWVGLGVATVVIWAIAAVLSITLPVFVTGTDPTRIPIAAMVAPPAAAVVTGLAGIVAGVFSTPPRHDGDRAS